jgi:C4-dicarboxylate-specific signal transduction histidine kinase
VSVVQKNLSHVPGLTDNRDFEALQTLTEGLTKIASMQLKPTPENRITPVDLPQVFDELRILIEASFVESGITVYWNIPENLSAVWADRYGLLQVFLNITRNSFRAMATSEHKTLTISAIDGQGVVVVRFEDSGPGIRDSEHLFRQFQSDADMNGLGLYVSRAILQTFHGDLRYERIPRGSCFAATLSAAVHKTAAVNE